MKIVKYKKLNGNKYEVTLDNDEKIKLYEDVILKEALLLKKEIVDLEDLLKKNKKYEIQDTALKHLAHHVVSIKEMQDYLSRKGYDEKDIHNVVDKLINKGYLNDLYYTKCYINDKINLSNDGPLKIIRHLEGNHIDSEIYVDILSSYQSIWKERIDKYLTKQLKCNKKSIYYFKSKMLINLINLGYEKDMITTCLNNIQDIDETELRKKEEEKIRNKLAKKYSGSELERKIKEKLYQKGFFNYQ